MTVCLHSFTAYYGILHTYRTPWSAAIHRRFSVKALAFTTLPSPRLAQR
ncbi:hypothetical protein THTE_0604 [Thermogutta terrifontis]|uniref:Uncharacterized protein n=1 Tax=Thermogutta terrifontis TaxID=1331910 RepID=A0A286RB67_9BACT|nr:hypothetical protein THTE_0604 [Thermogutta terrifontis]